MRSPFDVTERGEAVPTAYLRHVSPVAWDHISLTGDYLWDFTQITNFETLRTLQIA